MIARSNRSRNGALAVLAGALALLSASAGAQVPPAEDPPSIAPGEPSPPRAPAPLRRAGLISVQAYDARIRLDVRYATRRNFTRRVLPGYCETLAVMRPGPARDLAAVQQRLASRGLGLKVYDGYRPARASRAMVRWAERTGRTHLLRQGYIALRSRHNEGIAVDLTLVSLGSGRELAMGTRYDAFTTRSHTANASGRALRNRFTLKRAMEAEGFRAYRREWWHFEHRTRARRLDVPIGC